MAARGYTAYLVLRFLTESRSDPNFPIGFTANFLASHVNGIKSQTWLRMQELLEPLEKIEYVEKIRDGTTHQTHYKITDKGVAAYMRWKPIFEELVQLSYFGGSSSREEEPVATTELRDQQQPAQQETKPSISVGK